VGGGLHHKASVNFSESEVSKGYESVDQVYLFYLKTQRQKVSSQLPFIHISERKGEEIFKHKTCHQKKEK
jgi:hypothetical protein